MAPCPSRTYGAMLLTASLLAAFGVIFISADVYLGCVQDGPGPRAVPNLVEASDFVTLERCAARAKARGQTIYGVEYSRECYAGRDKAAAMVYGLSTNCNMKCSGNSSQTCGGRNALSLYQLADYTMPSMDDTAATYQGCFQDADGVDRRMTPLWTDDRMTIGYCAYLAKSEGYSIFGVQFAVECWGAKDIAYVTKLGTATTCNTPCNGDTTQMCGGPMTLGVYSISAVDAVVVPTPTPTDLNITKLGCFKDSGARQVKNLLKASTTMTSKECSQLAYAAGYTVIGIQYTNECWGDTDLASATVLGASTDCTNQCYQAPVGDCGGPLANTIYTVPAKAASTPPAPAPVGGAPTDPTPTPVPAPASAPLSNLNITALGCYADGTPRAMTLITADATMTVDKCAKLAYDIGYVVFALQYSQECWGSSSETTAKKFGTAPAKCTSPCVSDPAGSCGGGMANSLYRLEQPKAAADPVIVTPGPDPVVPTPNPAPVGTPPTTTLNITVLGCWNDNGASRAVPIALKASPTMTVEECANLAWAAKTRYNVFAVQYGGECYAGKNETLAMRYGPANNCNSACYADPAGTCGGGLANSLYRLPYREPLPPVAAPTGQNWTYKGCYQDSLGGQIRRVPAALGTNDGEMTPSKCAELALAQEYTVFALQFGGECFGGNDLDFATELGVLDEERCSMGCSGNPDQTCGGANANRVFSQPPPPIPADVPAYEHLGCFKDDYVPDDRFDPPYSTSRRMWRRLGVAKGMNSWECAKRAKAAGYPLFGITDYEWSWSKDYGYQCWGAFNVSLVTANGPSNGCVNPCKPWPGADMCGGDYAISLYQIKNMTYDQGAGGEYQYLLEMPISAAHIMQNTGQDTFTLIEFRDQSHPISFDETLETVTYMYLRNNNTWKPIKNNYDSSCGQWARMPDGDFMGFSGYFGASGLVHYAVWGTFWYHRHQYEVENFGLAAMPYGRTVHVINPLTGGLLAAAPELPRDNYWEYPLSGSQVAPVLKPNTDVSLHFVVFGGSTQATYHKPCADFSLRIRVDVKCSAKPCEHEFGEWEVETMPAPRCQQDTAVLPNGKVISINGVEEGYSGLGYLPNTNNNPVNEPWIYDPKAPVGQRYRRTGVYTNIARFYHGSAVMTSYGDILVAGSTVAAGFMSYHAKDFDVTPYDYGEFRIEFFKPHYILGPRPAWSFVPTMVVYDSTFTVKLAANTTADSIASIVMGDSGTTTHSSNMATRFQQLEFVKVDDHTLRVTAPANTFMAPPSFYMLFAVGKDDSYSVGSWFKLKGPWGAIPLSLPKPSKFVPIASTQGETEYVPWSVLSGSSAQLLTLSAAGAGSGQYGMDLVTSSNDNIVLASPALEVAEGARVHTFLWARASTDNKVHMQYMLLDSAGNPAGYVNDKHNDIKVAVNSVYEQFPLGGLVSNVTGFYHPALKITGLTPGMHLHLDDIEVLLLTAQDAADSLAKVKAGIEVEDQLGADGRILFETDTTSEPAALPEGDVTTAAAPKTGNSPKSVAKVIRRALMGQAGSLQDAQRGAAAQASNPTYARQLRQAGDAAAVAAATGGYDLNTEALDAAAATATSYIMHLNNAEIPNSVPDVVAEVTGRPSIAPELNPMFGVPVGMMMHRTSSMKGKARP